ncbi:probable E3 ubiquitin-protein ligase BAH1-like 1 [Impatiens glandulifera]|uniref:probable E3 ubiquitin-protein ligase BAH1-like 1 n=1 Tax=Impatiens glandulifera TaxID=253017 RepID=UPI001FB19C1D|nr:probable E3 ubiquitin-protein ligase BAH1-like 1 [Impatiens glandulifera]
MKFCKKYQEYMQEQHLKKLPGVGFKKLKKILNKCRRGVDQSRNDEIVLFHNELTTSSCPHQCPVCDGTFFPSLLKEMSDVVCCFNERAQKLMEVHLATGFRKYFIWCKDKSHGNHITLVQEGKALVTYAMINAMAIRKILKKYDKIHFSNQGQAFKSHVQSLHIEILQSPWLCELIAFHINLRAGKAKANKFPSLFEGCSLVFNDQKPSLSCQLLDSIKLDIDLTCSICLDTVFDPVALSCGHIFCYMCSCKAASVTIVDGLKAADHKEKCPLCREAGVYEGSVHLDELNILLSVSCPDYWKERLHTEKAERLQQAKEYWELQCSAFMGV